MKATQSEIIRNPFFRSREELTVQTEGHPIKVITLDGLVETQFIALDIREETPLLTNESAKELIEALQTAITINELHRT